jgi:hypothetical protein
MPKASCALLHRRSDRRRCPASQGFALPIAACGSLLLLLSSSSLQLLALQNRAQVMQQQRRLQIEDTLASAAQQQVAALQSAGAGCLLRLDQSQWSAAASACAISAEQLSALQQGAVGGSTYRISAYRIVAVSASTSTAELELQLKADRPWRATYRLSLAHAADLGTQITALQDLGLRGARA